MKVITVALAVALSLSLMTGCCNLRARSAPAKACLTNPCGPGGPCQRCPAPMPPRCPQLDK